MERFIQQSDWIPTSAGMTNKLALAASRILSIFVFTALLGCIYHRPFQVSTTSLGPKEIPVKTSAGSASAFYFLFLGPFGDDSLEAAIKNAVSNEKSGNVDTMVNVFVDRKILEFPFVFKKMTTTVWGTLIRYEDEMFKKQKTVTPEPRQKLTRSDPLWANITKGDKVLLHLLDGTTVEVTFRELDYSFNEILVEDMSGERIRYSLRTIKSVQKK